MAFLEELGKTLTDKGKVAAKKAKDITEALQLRAQVSSEKDKINDAYIKLGKAYYDKHRVADEEDFESEFETIRAGLMKIAELEDQICELEGNRACAECGAKLEKGSLFCNKCGASVEEKKEDISGNTTEVVEEEAGSTEESGEDANTIPETEEKNFVSSDEY